MLSFARAASKCVEVRVQARENFVDSSYLGVLAGCVFVLVLTRNSVQMVHDEQVWQQFHLFDFCCTKSLPESMDEKQVDTMVCLVMCDSPACGSSEE